VHAAPQNEEEIMRHAGTFFSLIWFPFFVAWIVMLAPQWKRKVRFIGWMRANRTSLAQLRWALAGLWITCLIVGGALAPPEPATKEVSAPTVSAPTPVAPGESAGDQQDSIRPVTVAEIANARVAFCAVHKNDPSTDITDLIPQCNLTYQRMFGVSHERAIAVMGRAFGGLVNNEWSLDDCR
jgi:hypothetical protein